MARSAEDDILDDDIQLKEEYELDIADENALLDLDEDEAPCSSGQRDAATGNVASIEYVDEEGNPVTVCDGDSLEIVDEYSYSEDRTNDDGDVLDVDVDPDFDSLIQENEDAENTSSGRIRSQRHRTPNQPQKAALNTMPAPHEQPEEPIPSAVAPEPAASPVRSHAESVDGETSRTLEDEEEEEEQEGRRGRFQTERRAGTVIATVASKRREAIPDSLDSVISEAEVAKIDSYLSREGDRRTPGRRGRGRGGANVRGQNNKRGGGGAARGGYRGAAQHIEPWMSPPFGVHGPGLVRFGTQSPLQRGYHPGAVAGADGPRGKIFVNPQFRNGAAGLGPGVRNQGVPLGMQSFQNPRGPPPFGNQQPEPFLRPPFMPQGGPPLLLRTEPFASPALLHPPQQPLPLPHVARQNAPPSHFAPGLEHFMAAGQPSGFDVSVQGPRPSEFSGPQPSGACDAFRQPQPPLDAWQSPSGGRIPPDSMQQHQQQHRMPMRQHEPPHQLHQQQQHQQHQQQLLHGQFGNSFTSGAPIQQQQQHHHQQQQRQQQQHQQQHQQQQQLQLQHQQQQPGSSMVNHPFQPGPPYQGVPLAQPSGGPPLMGHHQPGPNVLEQQQQQPPPLPPQQQRPFHQPPLAQTSVGGPFPTGQGTSSPRYASQVPTSTSFRVPPHFQSPPPREPFGKRPGPPLTAPMPPKAVRLEAPRMPRKPGQGPPGRTVNNANIKEVPILDYLPPPEPEKATLPPAIEEDVATQELRRKIEEQKKLREQVMRIKEERRKLAAMQRQKNLLEERLQATSQPQGNNVTPGAAGNSSEQPQPPASMSGGVKQRLGTRPAAGAPTQVEGSSVLKKVVIVRRTAQQQKSPPAVATPAQENSEVAVPCGTGSLRGRGGATVASRLGPMRTAGLAAASAPGAPRKVIRIVSNNGRLQAVNTAGTAGGMMQPLQVAPGTAGGVRPHVPGAAMLRPPSRPPNPTAIGRVLVSNLSASTNESALRQLGRSCGVITEIIIDHNQRQAVLKFREHQQAMQFQKKYQRHMLDLSMIQVSLLPP